MSGAIGRATLIEVGDDLCSALGLDWTEVDPYRLREEVGVPLGDRCPVAYTEKNPFDLRLKPMRERALAQIGRLCASASDVFTAGSRTGAWGVGIPSMRHERKLDPVCAYLVLLSASPMENISQEDRKAERLVLTSDLKRQLREGHHGRCALCGDGLARTEVDHIVPVWAGGPSVLENLWPLCGACHAGKGARLVDPRAAWETMGEPL